MQNLGQSGPTNCVFSPIACSKFEPKCIYQIAWFQFQKYKILQLLRGHIPPQTPPVRASGQLALMRHQIIPPNVEDGSMPLDIGAYIGKLFQQNQALLIIFNFHYSC